jgi:hypothetical protein
MTATDLASAARSEADRRARKYPALVASEKLSADEATIDYQAWHAIAVWLETGQFRTIDQGGANGATIVGWPEAEAAADRALADVTRKALAATDDAKRDRLNTRGAALRVIAGKVRLHRQLVESINAEFAARRETKAAA